jgi:hypothetical protein
MITLYSYSSELLLCNGWTVKVIALVVNSITLLWQKPSARGWGNIFSTCLNSVLTFVQTDPAMCNNEMETTDAFAYGILLR